MNVLIACEESQRVCIAFREKGHNAFSCDILPCSGGHPEWHILGDALAAVKGGVIITMDGLSHDVGKWDMLIAHPPCTYLSNAGARWLFPGGHLNIDRYFKGLYAKIFFMAMLNADCSKIAVENPIPSRIFNLPKYTQVIQPYQFGEPWSKKTCLWLKGLEPLQPTNILDDYMPYCSSGSYSRTHDPKYKGASRKGGSAKSRSRTFWGIARAMVEQWG